MPCLLLGKPSSIERPSKEQERALQAITNTLQAVYSSVDQSTRAAPKKRTVVKRSNGQLMTEEKVLHQLEQQREKQASKRVATSRRQPKPNKKQKANENGMHLFFVSSDRPIAMRTRTSNRQMPH